jgi:hypothetical protein
MPQDIYVPALLMINPRYGPGETDRHWLHRQFMPVDILHWRDMIRWWSMADVLAAARYRAGSLPRVITRVGRQIKLGYWRR